MVGIFDSGLGGLTALARLRIRRPDLDILYYGDTARVPYGTRSPAIIERYAVRALDFLIREGADRILIACGTVSSVALPRLARRYDVPLWGVVEPAARAAVRLTRNHRIGILGTEATIRSLAFENAVRRYGNAILYPVACPLFVSLAENGFTHPHDRVAREAAHAYLDPLRDRQPDTLILGCTHFPLLAAHISRVLPAAKLVGAGEAAADALCDSLPPVGHGETRCYVSDDPGRFAAGASRFLGYSLPCPVQLHRGDVTL